MESNSVIKKLYEYLSRARIINEVRKPCTLQLNNSIGELKKQNALQLMTDRLRQLIH